MEWMHTPEKSVHINIGGIWDCFDPFVVWVDVKAEDLNGHSISKYTPAVFFNILLQLAFQYLIFKYKTKCAKLSFSNTRQRLRAIDGKLLTDLLTDRT